MRALFYGLGSDGTVGANKNSIKIIGEETGDYAQGYFVYDSKKSGSHHVTHLRFGPRPIRSAYLITSAGFVACHQFASWNASTCLERAEPGATFLLNSPYGPEEVWDHLPRAVQEQLIDKGLRFFVIDGDTRGAGDGHAPARQHRHADLLLRPRRRAAPRGGHRGHQAGHREDLRQAGRGGRAEELRRRGRTPWPTCTRCRCRRWSPAGSTPRPPVPAEAPPFVQDVTAAMIAGQGDALPVSALPADGTYPHRHGAVGEAQHRPGDPGLGPDICIQCGKCVLVCPHAVIREKVYPAVRTRRARHGGGAPETFKSAPPGGASSSGWRYTLQVAPEDCTGCALCVEVCPAKDKRATRAQGDQHGAPGPAARRRAGRTGTSS